MVVLRENEMHGAPISQQLEWIKIKTLYMLLSNIAVFNPNFRLKFHHKDVYRASHNINTQFSYALFCCLLYNQLFVDNVII